MVDTAGIERVFFVARFFAAVAHVPSTYENVVKTADVKTL